MNEKTIERAAELISERSNDHSFVTLALMDLDGYPYTTTISISKSEGIKWLTLCTGAGAQAKRIANCNKASVCINEDTYHISLIGTIEEIMDLKTKKEMWYEGLANHFSGYEDPNYCVLKFTTDRYSMLVDWNSAKGTL